MNTLSPAGLRTGWSAGLCAALAFAPAALAGHGHATRSHDGRRGDEVAYARVVDSRPIFRRVRVTEPRHECWDEEVVHRERPGYWVDDRAAGTILGAIAGGVAGHQVGKGRGQDAATALGAVIGAGAGQQLAARHAPAPAEHVTVEQRCRTVHDTRFEERVAGYDVTYRFNGRLYHTRMPYDPGDRIPVRVDVEPVSY